MESTKRYSLKGETRDSYLELIVAFPLASINSEQQLAAAQVVMDRLLAQGKLNAGEMLYLDALSDLVASYEDRHHAIAPASDADMLRHLIESKGVTQANLSREAGISKSSVCEVLAGKKPFSRKMIRKLAVFFHVDPSVLAANL
jgi:HTH-type transcriptional regulator / antitoxin HigA